MKLYQFLNELEMLDFPDGRQSRTFSCGAAALQSVLVYYGFDIPEKEVMDKIGTDTEGSPVDNIKSYLDELGFKYQEKSYKIKDLKDFVDKKIPVIILIQAWSDDPQDWGKDANEVEDWEDGHYVVVVGYDDENIYFDDPSIHSQRGFIPSKELEKRWHDVDTRIDFQDLKYQKNKKLSNWGIAVFGKAIKFKSKEKVRIE